MENEWLTYEQAAERLRVSCEAVRQKAIRGRWQRTIGNDKRALVRLPDGWTDTVRTASERASKRGRRTPNGRASDASLIKALEEHVATLTERLATADARAEKLAAEFAARDAKNAADLATERAKTEAERAKAERAIAEFSALADRLATLVEARAKPWWRRLVG